MRYFRRLCHVAVLVYFVFVLPGAAGLFRKSVIGPIHYFRMSSIWRDLCIELGVNMLSHLMLVLENMAYESYHEVKDVAYLRAPR